NRLDFESVSQALQIMWDEQLAGVRKATHPNSGYGPQVFSLEAGDWGRSSEHGWPGEDEASDYYYHEHEDGWHGYDALFSDSGWWDDELYPVEEMEHELTNEEAEDEKIREAMQAEKAAEALATEANLTWKKAQKATADMRRDRGFGAVRKGMSKGKGSSCYKCGRSGHFARDCPLGSGKGSYMIEDDWSWYQGGLDSYAFIKGKNKGKGKGKNHFGMFKGYPKGKGPQGSRFSFPGVNAYGLEMLGTQSGQLDDAPTRGSTLPPGTGLLDCGATASAGPEASVQRLITAVLEKDKSAIVSIDQARRPYFRYGSGSWGRALYHVVIKSNVSGSLKAFGVYALPNPPEYFEKWFSEDMLVPILVGMSHIGRSGAGMIVDFSDGYFVNANDPNLSDKPQYLSRNDKGHFVLDVVDYLTAGQNRAEGSCQLHVACAQGEAELPSTEMDVPLKLMYPLELCGMSSEISASRASEHQRRALMQQLVDRRQQLNDPKHFGSRMVASTPTSPHVNNSFAQHNGSQEEHRASPASGRESGNSARSKRCSFNEDDLAVLRATCRSESGQQSPRAVDGVRNVCPAVTVRRAMKALHEDLGNQLPTHELVKVAIEVEYAKNRYEQLLRVKGYKAKSLGATEHEIHTPVDKVQPWATEVTDPELLGNPNAVEMDDGVISSQKHEAPWRVCQALLTMASIMVTKNRKDASDLLVGDCQKVVWEIGGTVESPLATACEKAGLPTQRIGHFNEYDLYKQATYPKLQEMFRVQQPRILWFSPRGFCWSPEANLHDGSWEGHQRGNDRQHKERTMLYRMSKFLLWCLEVSPGTHIYWEWPPDSLGWKDRSARQFEESIKTLGKEWLRCRLDGCRYGMELPTAGSERQFLQEKWLVKTTCPVFHSLFKTKVCVQPHQHAPANHIARNARVEYPIRMVEAFTRCWNDLLYPPDLSKRLHRKLDVNTSEMTFAAALLPEAPPKWRDLEAWTRELRERQDFKFDTFEQVALELQRAGVLKTASHQRWKSSTTSSVLFGGYSHGGFSGVSKWSSKLPQTVLYLNMYLQHHLPGVPWTSLSVPHRDQHNLGGTPNVLHCVGKFVGGGLWLEGYPEKNTGHPLCRRKLRDGSFRLGHICETKNKFVMFSPKQLHATQEWHGCRVGISAYTTRTVSAMEPTDLKLLDSLGFPFRESYDMQTLEKSEHVMDEEDQINAVEALDLLPVEEGDEFHAEPPEDPSQVEAPTLSETAVPTDRELKMERAWHYATSGEEPHKWQTLRDIIPAREYEDLAEELPPGECDGDLDPDLPEEPSQETWAPVRRLRGKQTKVEPYAKPVETEENVNDYHAPADNTQAGELTETTGTSEPRGLHDLPRERSEPVEEPDAKRYRESSLDNEEALFAQLHETEEEIFHIDVDLSFSSNREKK
ncbi:TY1B-NL2, partial [Symbiodinium necroappetens]